MSPPLITHDEALALYARKPRKKRDAEPKFSYAEMGVDLARALNRVAELERELAEHKERWAGADEIALRLYGRIQELEGKLARLHSRAVGRGGARVRELRQTLRLTRLMLARQQAARGAGGLKLHLVGGKEHLKKRLAELPSVGNPYTSLGGS